MNLIKSETLNRLFFPRIEYRGSLIEGGRGREGVWAVTPLPYPLVCPYHTICLASRGREEREGNIGERRECEGGKRKGVWVGKRRRGKEGKVYPLSLSLLARRDLLHEEMGLTVINMWLTRGRKVVTKRYITIGITIKTTNNKEYKM